MAFADYTTPDSVRALLGVSSKELKDATITDVVYLTTLLEKLEEVTPGFADIYAAARDAEPRTSQENRLVLLVQSFCGYEVALALIPAMPLLAPQTISDGRSEIARVDNPFTALEPDLTAARDYIRMRMKLAYSAVTGNSLGGSSTRRNVSVVSPGIDPIAG